MTKGIRPLAAVVAVAAAAGMAGSAQAANGVDTTAVQEAVEVGDQAGTERNSGAPASPAGNRRWSRVRTAPGRPERRVTRIR